MSAATDMNDSASKKAAKNSGRLTQPHPHKGQSVSVNGNKLGRPSTFSQEIADRICEHIANGGYATKLERFGLPSSTTLGKWLNENEEFAAQYARARERRAEHFANEMVEIADTADDPAKARLQVETRKWVASKLFPRMYGENQRVEVQHTISETAARVLADLAQRQKDRKRLEAQVIDVTPERSLAEGGVEGGNASNINALADDCTDAAPISHGSGVPDAPASSPPLPHEPPVPPPQQRRSLSKPRRQKKSK
jgi:glycerol-3-phosphate dehydrogenase